MKVQSTHMNLWWLKCGIIESKWNCKLWIHSISQLHKCNMLIALFAWWTVCIISKLLKLRVDAILIFAGKNVFRDERLEIKELIFVPCCTETWHFQPCRVKSWCKAPWALASYPGYMWGEKWPGIGFYVFTIIFRKTWESIYVGRCSHLPVKLPSTPWK